MRQKRGQIGLFILLGLVILLAVAALFYIKSDKTESAFSEIPEAVAEELSLAEIQSYVESCLQKAGREGVYLTSLHGGYINPSGASEYNEEGDGAFSGNYYYFGNTALPFVLDGNEKKLRKKGEIERVLSNYIMVEAGECIGRLEAFSGRGLEFEYGMLGLDSEESKVEATIRKDDVLVELEWPLSVKKEDKSAELERFRSTVKLRMGLLYEISENLVADIAYQRPFDIHAKCDDYLDDADDVNIYLESNPYTYEYVIRVVDGEPVKGGDLPLRFHFAVKNVEAYGECVG